MKTVILTILVFGVIIMLHESGHFLFAKLFHVNVEEFSFGMGPKLWSRIKRGTQYTIRAFPIGGYVQLSGRKLFPRQRAAHCMKNQPGSGLLLWLQAPS